MPSGSPPFLTSLASLPEDTPAVKTRQQSVITPRSYVFFAVAPPEAPPSVPLLPSGHPLGVLYHCFSGHMRRASGICAQEAVGQKVNNENDDEYEGVGGWDAEC